MKITIWHKSGAGTELSADDFAYIEVDGKTVWNESALKLVEGQKPPTNTGSTKLRKIIIELGCRGVIGASERDTAIVDEICKREGIVL